MRFTSGSWCHVPRNITLYGVLCVFLWTYCIYLYGNGWPTVPLPARFFQASDYTNYSINENRIGSKIGKHLEWNEVTEVYEVMTTAEAQAWTDEAPETGNYGAVVTFPSILVLEWRAVLLKIAILFRRKRENF